jgi:hypothetical protein
MRGIRIQGSEAIMLLGCSKARDGIEMGRYIELIVHLEARALVAHSHRRRERCEELSKCT